MFYSSPYLRSSYHPSSNRRPQDLDQERARLLAQQQAQQRARRALYLPHEDEESDDELYQFSPWDARKRQEDARRRREEEILHAKRQEQAKRDLFEHVHQRSQVPEQKRVSHSHRTNSLGY